MGALDGKAIVITGAGRGLGRAFALFCAREGAAVVVNDIDADVAEQTMDEITTQGGRAVAHPCSVTSWEDAGELIRHCVESFGALDGLVNNAGVFYVTDPWDDSPEEMCRLIEINVLGTMYCGLHAMRAMRRRGRGSILNVTSGALAGLPQRAAYGASKGAVTSLTYSWALDLMQHSIRVNALSPIAHTRMADAMAGRPSHVDATHWTPERVAPLVAYLLSDLSADITGQVVRLSGDELSLMSPPATSPPILRCADWTLDAVKDTFDNTLRGALRPVGLLSTAYEWN